MRRAGPGARTSHAALRARMRRPALLMATLVALVSATALSQPALVVNGRDIVGNTTSLVSGASYAPAPALAAALGATLAVDLQQRLIVLDAGGRLLQLDLVDSPAAAGAAGDGIRLDGRSLGGPAALLTNGEVYLPVKQVSEALGASVTYLQSQNTVLVVQPRARLTALRRSATPERLEVSLSAPVRYNTFFNEPTNTLQLHFERTDVEVRIDPVEGERFVLATTVSTGGGTEVRIQLDGEVGYEVYQIPDGRGSRVIVAFAEPGQNALVSGLDVVIDPGHGGADLGLVVPGFGSESSLALGFAERLAAALRQRGLGAELTRDSDHALDVQRRSRAGTGADLFISVHVADLPSGDFNAYYLADAANVASLDMAIRNNAEGAAKATTDRLRRELLLGLVPELEQGRLLADGLSGRLFSLGAYRANVIAGSPLQVLGGAAGRGVLLEFSAADLTSDELPQALAQAVAEMLEQEAVLGRR